MYPEDHKNLWELLLAPPPLFCLSLVESGKIDNQLHLSTINDHAILTAETPLFYTIDNVVHEFTVYELKEGCKWGMEGKSPGVRALARVLGEHPIEQDKYVEGRRGRPPKHDDDDVRRVVSKKSNV